MTMTKAQPLQTRTETRNVQSVTLFVDYAPRCSECHLPLAIQATRPWIIMCKRHKCRTVNHSKSETV